MEKKDGILQVDLNQVANKSRFDYIDDDIAICRIGEQPEQDQVRPIRTNNILLLIGMTGQVRVRINSDEITLQAGEILFCRPFSIIDHVEQTPDFRAYVFCLNTHSLRGIIPAGRDTMERIFFLSRCQLLRLSEPMLRLRDCYLQLIHTRLQMPNQAYLHEVVGTLTQAIVYELIAGIERSTPTLSDNQLKQGDILFGKFIRMLANQDVPPRSVDYYGKALCVTPKYLSTVCKALSGKTASQWISECVMLQIKYYLRYTELSIKEISERMEFPNLSFFGKYVKAHLGMSPKEYRKQLTAEAR
ncbi:MAG: helix-turn-helix domain-containing protein [Bacteroidaceae bacterium]